MHALSQLLAIVGVFAGAYAGLLWWQASKSQFTMVGIMRAGGCDEALNDLSQWTLEICDEIKKSNAQNRVAAGYTILSVLSSALSAWLA